MKKRTAGLRRVLPLAILAAMTAASPGVYAQTEQATKEAEARFKEGLGRHDAGDEEGARLSFLQAYSVLKRPNILFNLARAEQLTGHPVEALAHYKLFVADGTVGGADRETAKKRVLELTPLVGHVAIDAPAGADLWIDGQPLASKAPLREPADVAAGTHTVQARLGDQTKTVSVSCAAGQTVAAKVDLVLTGRPLVIVPIPGEAPASTSPSPPGLVHEENTKAKVITVVALGVGAVAFLGVGIGLEVASSNALNTENDDLSALGKTAATACSGTNLPAACGPLHNAAQAHVTDGNAAVGTLATAGVLGAAAIITWAVWPKKNVSTSAAVEGVRVVPMASPQMGGLAIAGSF